MRSGRRRAEGPPPVGGVGVGGGGAGGSASAARPAAELRVDLALPDVAAGRAVDDRVDQRAAAAVVLDDVGDDAR